MKISTTLLAFLFFFTSAFSISNISSADITPSPEEDRAYLDQEVETFFNTFEDEFERERDKINPPPKDKHIPFFFMFPEVALDRSKIAIGLQILYILHRHPVQRLLRHHAIWEIPFSQRHDKAMREKGIIAVREFINALIGWRWGTPLDVLDPPFTHFLSHTEHHFHQIYEPRLGLHENEKGEKYTLLIEYYPLKEKKIARVGGMGELFSPFSRFVPLLTRQRAVVELDLTQTPFNDNEFDKLGARVAKQTFRALMDLQDFSLEEGKKQSI